ncbi:MAG: hypothetical protein AB7P34_16605 [Vicinamibacterales bacterium]
MYWTIIVDGQPTAFRSGSLEDIMPTFNRLKEKQPTAELKWFQNGQLWPSRHDAQDFMRARGERGRANDPRQSEREADAPAGRPERAWNAKPEWKTRSTFAARSDRPRVNRDTPAGERPAWVPKGDKPSLAKEGKPEWKPRGDSKPAFAPRSADASTFAKAPADRPARPAASRSDERPEWKPKGTFKPKEPGHSSGWGEKPAFARRPTGSSAGQARDRGDKAAWKPKGDTGGKSGERPEWKPKGTFKPREEGHRPTARDQARSSFKPKAYTPKVDDGRTRSSRVQSRNDKLEWQPKGAPSREDGPNSGFRRGGSDAPASDGPKRKWVPKAEYKKSLGIEAKRDDKWRPGGEHKDPKQKYKDAKKAKWTKFKANIRARSAGPRKPKDE